MYFSKRLTDSLNVGFCRFETQADRDFGEDLLLSWGYEILSSTWDSLTFRKKGA